MNERADYIRGLRTLAQLLEDNPDLSLPYDGPTKGLGQSIFIDGTSQVIQALLFIQAMDEPPTMELNRQSHDLTWLDVKGHIEGLHVRLHLQAHKVCEPIDPYRAPDGSVREWAIPAELRDAAGGEA
jgi:hypothetical protein